jgi:hypothetical protein
MFYEITNDTNIYHLIETINQSETIFVGKTIFTLIEKLDRADMIFFSFDYELDKNLSHNQYEQMDIFYSILHNNIDLVKKYIFQIDMKKEFKYRTSFRNFDYHHNPLTFAIQNTADIEIIKLLINNDVDIKHNYKDREKNMFSAMYLSSSKDDNVYYYELINILYQHGCNILDEPDFELYFDMFPDDEKQLFIDNFLVNISTEDMLNFI